MQYTVHTREQDAQDTGEISLHIPGPVHGGCRELRKDPEMGKAGSTKVPHTLNSRNSVLAGIPISRYLEFLATSQQQNKSRPSPVFSGGRPRR